MTKKQRAQVVELLRCAADVTHQREAIQRGAFLAPIMDAALRIYDDFPHDIYGLALEAREQCFDIEDRTTRFLEAAARVEEGSWP